jgi:hypothetical protein
MYLIFNNKGKEMKQCKCPKCGHTQKTQKIKKDNSFNSRAMDFLFKSLNAVPVLYVACEKCKISFEQDANLVEEK